MSDGIAQDALADVKKWLRFTGAGSYGYLKALELERRAIFLRARAPTNRARKAPRC